jgi:SLT domain-containing protein
MDVNLTKHELLVLIKRVAFDAGEIMVEAFRILNTSNNFDTVASVNRNIDMVEKVLNDESYERLLELRKMLQQLIKEEKQNKKWRKK